jgi:hypothetical protein
MNLREGTRRLALLLGVAGAILGAIGSYSYLQPILHQRELHKIFEQLAESDVVKAQRKILQSPDPLASNGKPTPDSGGHDIEGLPPGAILKPLAKHQGRYGREDVRDPWDEAAADKGAMAAWQQGQPTQWQYVKLPDGNYQQFPASYSDAQIHAVLQRNYPNLFPSTVSKDGIKTINWNHDFAVASIEMADGQTLSSTPAPAAGQYLLVALLPLFGFIIPWGAVRAIGWVVAGFVPSTK